MCKIHALPHSFSLSIDIAATKCSASCLHMLLVQKIGHAHDIRNLHALCLYAHDHELWVTDQHQQLQC